MDIAHIESIAAGLYHRPTGRGAGAGREADKETEMNRTGAHSEMECVFLV
jgi:hypothetical protein